RSRSVSSLEPPTTTDLALSLHDALPIYGDGNSQQTSLTTSSLGYGDKVTCTITNSRLPQLKVIKTFVGDTAGRVDLGIDANSYTNGRSGFVTSTHGTGSDTVSTLTDSMS